MTLFSFIVAISSQDVLELECQYEWNEFNEYVCLLIAINVPSRETAVVFTGEHVPGYNETDVRTVVILFSNTTFIMPEIYTTFPNMIELNIEFSNLKEIDPIPDTVQLQYFIVYFNDVLVIRDDTFATQSESLVYAELMLNDMEILEENAFVGLDTTIIMALRYNELQDIHPRAFWPLTSASLVDLGWNNIERIEDEMFSMNQRLSSLHLERNSITAISPIFSREIRDNLVLLILEANPCIDRYFVLDENIIWALMHNSLQNCYANFVGSDGQDTRTITIEFRGALKLYDENGNIVFAAY